MKSIFILMIVALALLYCENYLNETVVEKSVDLETIHRTTDFQFHKKKSIHSLSYITNKNLRINISHDSNINQEGRSIYYFFLE